MRDVTFLLCCFWSPVIPSHLHFSPKTSFYFRFLVIRTFTLLLRINHDIKIKKSNHRKASSVIAHARLFAHLLNYLEGIQSREVFVILNFMSQIKFVLAESRSSWKVRIVTECLRNLKSNFDPRMLFIPECWNFLLYLLCLGRWGNKKRRGNRSEIISNNPIIP